MSEQNRIQVHPIPAFRDNYIWALRSGSRVAIPELGAEFEVLDIPGHTRAHIAYYGSNMVFCGDTLFACGCGRVFEGTPPQLHASLQKLAALPDETLVYRGHEYTSANIRFARAVEPGNVALVERRRADTSTREENRPTVATTIGREKATNPFLRFASPTASLRADSRRTSYTTTGDANRRRSSEDESGTEAPPHPGAKN